jgi:hypothetical protein
MKKIIFILIAAAFIAGGFWDRQVTANSSNGKNIKTMEILNECWTEEGNSENKIVWYENGTFSFTETNPKKTYSAFGSGTYIYQPETREIFAQVTDLNERQVVSDTTKYAVPFKKYFLIIQITDSMVVVLSIPSEYEIDWSTDEKGKLHVTIINTDLVFDEFPPFEEKPKYYKRSKLKIDKVKNE